MTVYVDQSIFPFRGTKYCHAWADTLDELHAAAQAVGLRRDWFQQPPKASWQHYDCAPSKRAALVALGAVETDKFGPLEWQGLRGICDPDPEEREWWHRRLAMVFECRCETADLFGIIR